MRHFCNVRLGLSERAMQTVTWPEVAHRIVEVWRSHCCVLLADVLPLG